ncbi:MAG: 3-hydroxyacyl-CoA dehydrogenase NAD-binding domain-containing protein [Niveispirillum sp.]|uniref:3-hydroxyacyl-CoA dehydrogenase NAD-binding domain-containing protein n=1 Tax=Niveispirillum sp. TaxID=1917217 RepID=UPI003BA63868
MSDPVNLSVEDGIAFVIIDNPPVNALSGRVAAGLRDRVTEAAADPAVIAIVLTAFGRTFIAGADITEFGGDGPTVDVHAVLAVLEDCAKPVVAALHGTIYGGGLEVAMACHYRIADDAARLGLPEVKLGLLPGAGGTQRLPRLIGVAPALEMISTGKPVTAQDALNLGLVDRLSKGDVRTVAARFAATVARQKSPPPRTRTRTVIPPAPSFWDEAAARIGKSLRGLPAGPHILACVRAAVERPFKEGLDLEGQAFAACVRSRESEALRHLFFAERRAARIKDIPRDTPTRPIARVGVIGAGTMGGGIAMCFASAGYPVTLVDINEAALTRGLSTIQGNYAASVAKGRLAAIDRDAALSRIRTATDYAAFTDADLVIEAAFEDMDLKLLIFRDLDRVCRPGAILASNTSTLNIDQMAAATARPGDVLGLHFFSPANVMRLLEVVRGAATTPDVMATAMDLARRLGKVAVVSGVCDGFIGNRMVAGYGREANLLMLEGVEPARIDKALTEFGFPMGPIAMGDMVGLDIGVKAAAEAEKAGRGSDDPRPGIIAKRLVAAGRLGQKTGAGLYRYEPGGRRPLPDPAALAIIADAARELGIEPRDIDDQEIVDRCILPLVNEAARILAEGIAQRPGDIDIVWVNGYGFPSLHGGPLFHADTIGLPKVLDRIRQFQDRHGPRYWTPAPLLETLVAEGRRFAELED